MKTGAGRQSGGQPQTGGQVAAGAAAQVSPQHGAPYRDNRCRQCRCTYSPPPQRATSGCAETRQARVNLQRPRLGCNSAAAARGTGSVSSSPLLPFGDCATPHYTPRRVHVLNTSANLLSRQNRPEHCQAPLLALATQLSITIHYDNTTNA
ncbi:hypothetical protein J6590_024498 [Homalodisca vitripennis]|nr:hypothetical protein J6590_024498 [Homalodisca vitripennis]